MVQFGKPRLFIASSDDGHEVVDALLGNLEGVVESTASKQGVFLPGEWSLSSLDQSSRGADYAVIVLTPDTMTASRRRKGAMPYRTVLLEIGMIVGRIGAERTFVVTPRSRALGLPSELAGLTIADYEELATGGLRAALAPVCAQIRRAIERVSQSIMEEPSSSAFAHVPKRRKRRNSLGIARSVGASGVMPVVNMSVTGALLETRGEIPIGQVMDLVLDLDNGASVHVTGRVVRVQRPDWGRVGGVGVLFTDIAAGDQRLLATYVDGDLSGMDVTPSELKN